MRSKWFGIFLCLALVVGLVIPLSGAACAPKAPASEVVPKSDLTKAQADLTKEQQKSTALDKQVKDLQAQLAASQKPAKVYRMEPGSWASAGQPWDFLQYISESLNTLSNGRIVMTPSSSGAICPVEEQIETVSAGATTAMLSTASYYAGKIPIAALYNTSIGLPSVDDMVIAYEYFENGRIKELYFSEIEKRYSVKVVGTRYGLGSVTMGSKVPIRNLAELKGVKIRCGDEHLAVPLTQLGASTVWVPWTEVYTAVATGVFDAFVGGNPYDYYSLGLHEVSKYWIKKPAFQAAYTEDLVINMDTWNEMPEDLHKLLFDVMDSGNYRIQKEAIVNTENTWKLVREYGIQIVSWTDEDVAVFVQAQMDWAKKYTDQYPECAEFMQIIQRYDESMGYL